MDHEDIIDEYDDMTLDEDEKISDQSKLLCQKYENRVDFSAKNTNQNRDKGDRATTDHAIDKRTALIIFKLIHQGCFTEINGCISTGIF